MSIKRILLPINGRDDVSAVAKLAFAVARKISASIEVLHPHTPYYEIITAVGEGGSPMQVSHDIEAARKNFEKENREAKNIYSKLAKANPEVKSEYVELSGRTSDIVTRRAFSSDLIVLGNVAAFDTPFWRDVYDGALIHSTRPVLIAPANSQMTINPENFATELLIAWGGTAESARAITAAEPFFATAKQVDLLTISDDQTKVEIAEQMKEYAELHGAKANLRIVRPDNKGIAKTLLDEASVKPGTLLVMGAYSHARWRERFFGGVTEHVLHHAHIPVLMAH
jgi:nucleotide-binding universal stress UspA family protein